MEDGVKGVIIRNKSLLENKNEGQDRNKNLKRGTVKRVYPL